MSKAGKVCSVNECKNYGMQLKTRSFFRFPKDEEL